MSADSPYPELKKARVAERLGRPWRSDQPPSAAPVWAVIQGYSSYWLLMASIDLGVFDALHRYGTSSGGELAARLGAAPRDLAAVLDGLVVLGLLEQVDDRYLLNDTAERYLLSDGPATMAALVALAPGPHDNWRALPSTIRGGRPPRPVDRSAEFYRPLVRATFPTQHRAARRAAGMIGWGRTPGAPRVLDLGAGGAPWAMALLEHPAATAVVNDLPGVIEEAATRAAEAGVADRVELRPGSYHDVELEDGEFDAVVLGHVCRAEGEAASRRLVARSWSALRPGGRLLLADYFADNRRKHNTFGVLMGATMTASTTSGQAVTHADAHQWLVDIGFAPIRLLEPIALNHVFVATKPRSCRDD